MADETLGEAQIETSIDLDGLDKGIDEAEKKTKSGFAKIGDIMKGALSVGIAAGATVIAAGIAGIAGGIGDAREAAQIMAQTQAVITSTGGAAGYTADQIADMAGELSAASGNSLFGDSDIQQGQNLLLTFTNIKETLPDATKTMVDLAQAMGTDVKGGAIQLGKALNDPINGVSALSRVGVTFTEEQKAQIKTMQDAGDMAGAQKIILAELNKEFGGSAAAAAAADGGMAQFNDQMGELWETIGALFLPVINQAMSFLNTTAMPILTSIVEAISGLSAAFGDAGAGSSELSEAAGFLATQLGLPGEAVQGLVVWFQDVLPPVIATLSAFFTDTLVPALQSLATYFMSILPPAIATLTTYWNTVLLPVVTALVELWQSQLQPALTELLGWLQEQLPVAIQFLSDIWNTVLLPAIQTIAAFIADPILPVLGILVQWLRTNLPIALQYVTTMWNTVLLPALRIVAAFIMQQVIPAIMAAVKWLRDTLPPAIQKAADFFNTTILPAISALSGFITGQLIPGVSSAVHWLGDIASKANEVAKVLNGAIKTNIESLAKLFSETLTTAINGAKLVITGVTTWFTDIATAISGVITMVGDFIKKLGEVKIPSWLQGRSPPPLADWFSYIADAAGQVTSELPSFRGMGIGNLAPSALAMPSTSSGSGQAGVNVSLNDNGLGWLRNLIRVEVTSAVDMMARNAKNRGR